MPVLTHLSIAAPAVARRPGRAEVQLLPRGLGGASRPLRAAGLAGALSGARVVRQPHREMAPVLLPPPGTQRRGRGSGHTLCVDGSASTVEGRSTRENKPGFCSYLWIVGRGKEA